MKLSNTKSIRFTNQQIEAFEKLEQYNVNVSKFIRAAISEKIKRDWKKIKETKSGGNCPF